MIVGKLLQKVILLYKIYRVEQYLTGPVPINDMQKSGQIIFFVQKDAQYSETYEKINFPIFSF